MSPMTASKGAPCEAFYHYEPDVIVPNASAQGPWHPDHQNGSAFAGLLAHLAAAHCREWMMVAQLSIAILGPGLMEPMTSAARWIRTGSRLAMLEVALIQHGRAFATATATLVRHADTPSYGVPAMPDAPRSDASWPPIASGAIGAVVEARLVDGVPAEPGSGTAWARLTGQIVAGTPASALSQAAVIADFASGLSAGVDKREWSFANLSLDLSFLRPPQPGWHLLEAKSLSAGVGSAMTALAMYDEAGLYARSGQTLFIDRRMPAR